MKRNQHLVRVAGLAGAVLALAACGEKPQGLGGVKQDSTAYSGTGSAYVVPGWKQGDKASWEQQMRARTQTGQNDNVKTN
jgi:hypothetical protein